MHSNTTPLELLPAVVREPRRRSVTRYPHELLSPMQVAYALGISSKTLAEWRTEGRALNYVNVAGRIRYRRTEVQCWLDLCQRRVLSMETLMLEPVQDGANDHD